MNVFSKADKAQLTAVQRLNSHEFAPLIKLFENVLEDTKLALIFADDMGYIHRLQGRAQVISQFLETVKNAGSILERLNK